MPRLRAFAVAMVQRAHRSIEAAIAIGETVVIRPPLGPAAHVPLADQGSVVTEAAQHFRHGQRFEGIGVIPARLRAVRSEAARIAPRHQSHARRRALRLDVVPVQLHALTREPVEMRRADVGCVIADVGPALIVGDDDEDVGALGVLRG